MQEELVVVETAHVEEIVRYKPVQCLGGCHAMLQIRLVVEVRMNCLVLLTRTLIAASSHYLAQHGMGRTAAAVRPVPTVPMVEGHDCSVPSAGKHYIELRVVAQGLGPYAAQHAGPAAMAA